MGNLYMILYVYGVTCGFVEHLREPPRKNDGLEQHFPHLPLGGVSTV